MKTLFLIWACLLLAIPCSAGIIYVDPNGTGDYPTIQAAINAAINGDIVLVADGTYMGTGNRDIDFKGKAITVQSENGPDGCVIDCEATQAEQHRGFSFQNGEGSDSVLNGLTIINGYKRYTGGIYCESSSPTLINCTFSDNTTHLSLGGGMCNWDSSPTLTNCIFNNNSASKYEYGNGGGMYNHNSSLTLTNCIFSNNSAGREGGGMYNHDSNLTLTNCIFSNNSAPRGGGIYNLDSNLTLTNCIFSNNWAGLGGGIRIDHSNATIVNCEFSNNFVGNTGGGLYIYDGSNPRIENCIVRNNIARSKRGGGIYCGANSPAVLVDSDIIENSANLGGGGVFCSHSSMKISNCKFISNSALGYSHSGYGGGLQIHTNSAKVTNCLFVGNWAKLKGGGLSDYGSSSLISSNTFSGNSAGVQGGGMNIIDSSPTIINCILSGNEAPEGYEISTKGDSHPVVSYCDIEGGLISPFVESESGSSVVDGGDNIYDNPLFVNLGYWDGDTWINGDYHLQEDSPCIDKGSNNPPGGLATEDLDKNTRIINATVDIGAYETIPPSIETSMNYTPKTLNCSSHGNWVKAHFILPSEFSIDDVDANTPATIDSLSIKSDHTNVSYNIEGLVEVEVAFSRSDFCVSGLYGDVQLTVRGWFADRTGFYGTDSVRITTNKLAEFISYWLEEDCGMPDWCGGLDVDQDSVVNFVDFALFDSCCIEVIEE